MENHGFNLNLTQSHIDRTRNHIKALVDRRNELAKLPGGRFMMKPEQKVEFDLIGALFADLRNTLK